ncbi:phosphoglycolate phosphatase [Paramagnetospirillum kuznetsovii]|uniref:Phosphoglycolate phosphatase n=1 Tax=Paramagnetospirillum kuznetsovii TaxID=2053833 RepID=A0A364P2J4_9PROT|nr:phosphoglycolate phosphatase [Paramagnetospirillum kuznetsovii]RAU23578.1 phosphoglycolate phosphatase [Paramagnetospirillum kuznetsovii]
MSRAIVFDLDGTLIDSAPDVANALNRLLAEEGRPTLSLPEVQQLVGEGASALIERAWTATGASAATDAVRPLVERYLAFYRACPADHTHVYDGVRDELARLAAAGHRLGICTNKPDGMTNLVLETLGLAPLFAAVVGGDYVRRKPDGEHVRETLRQMGAEGMQAIYVGDSRTDVLAAKDAGLPVVAVTYGYARMPVEQLGADILIERFGDLGAAMDKVSP